MEYFHQIALWCAVFFVLAAIACGIMSSISVFRDVTLPTTKLRLRAWLIESLSVPGMGLLACFFLWLFADVFWVMPSLVCAVVFVMIGAQLLLVYAHVQYSQHPNG